MHKICRIFQVDIHAGPIKPETYLVLSLEFQPVTLNISDQLEPTGAWIPDLRLENETFLFFTRMKHFTAFTIKNLNVLYIYYENFYNFF